MAVDPPPFQPIGTLLDTVYPSFALLAGMQLDLFTALQSGPVAVEALAERMDARPEKLGPLLYALVAAGLLTVEGGRFANTAVADYFLVRGRAGYIGDCSALLADIWQGALRTADTIRSGVPQARHDFNKLSWPELIAYFRGLHGDSLEAGRLLAESCDFSGYGTLLDVGGGSGGLAMAITDACSHLQATVVDLPNVIPVTEHFIAQSGASTRVRARAADVVSTPLSGAYDVAVFKSFFQTLSPAEARQALANVSAALVPGATVYILGAGILNDDRVSPPAAAVFNIVFLNFYDGGQAYTESEHGDWLRSAGFERIARLALGNGAPVLRAMKPG